MIKAGTSVIKKERILPAKTLVKEALGFDKAHRIFI